MDRAFAIRLTCQKQLRTEWHWELAPCYLHASYFSSGLKGVTVVFVKTHPQRDMYFDRQWDRPPKGTEEMFFAELMRCGDRGMIFYIPSVSALIHIQRDFLCRVFLLPLKNPCVFDGPYAGHFLPSTGAVQSLISHLHKLTWRQHRGLKAEGIGVHVFPHFVLCFPLCACLFVFPCVCVHMCGSLHVFFSSRFCPYGTEWGRYCFVFIVLLHTDRWSTLFKSAHCRRSLINAASATRPSARREGWTSTWGPTRERSLSNVM